MRKSATSRPFLSHRRLYSFGENDFDATSFLFFSFSFVRGRKTTSMDKRSIVRFFRLQTSFWKCQEKPFHLNGIWRLMKWKLSKNVHNYDKQRKLSFWNSIEIHLIRVFRDILWVSLIVWLWSSSFSVQVDPQNTRLYAFQMNSYRYLYTSPRILLGPALFVLVGGFIQYFAQKERVNVEKSAN